jgi:hypothetical protein
LLSSGSSGEDGKKEKMNTSNEKNRPIPAVACHVITNIEKGQEEETRDLESTV